MEMEAAPPHPNAPSPESSLFSPSPMLSSSSSFSSTTVPSTTSSASFKTDCSSRSYPEHDGDQFATYLPQWPPSAPTLNRLSKPLPTSATEADEHEPEKQINDLCVALDDVGLVLSTKGDAQSFSRRRLIESKASKQSDALAISGPFAHHRSPSWVAGAHTEGRTRARSSAAAEAVHSRPRLSQSPLPSTMLPNGGVILAADNGVEIENPSRTSSLSTSATDATRTKSASRIGSRTNALSPKARHHTDESVSSTLSFKHRGGEENQSNGGDLPSDFPKGILTSSSASLGLLSSTSSQSSIAFDDTFWLADEAIPSATTEEAGNDVSLAVSTAEEGIDVRFQARDVQLEDIEHCLSARTTHLILSGSQSVSTLAFLERALSIVAPSLLVLDVSSTGLQEFPEALAKCRRLEELNVSNNPLVQGPASNIDVLATLSSSLRVLMIDGCGLTMLPIVLIELKQLRLLSLCHNHLVHLPAWLHRLRSLKSLLLAGNPFQGAWKSVCQPFCLATSTPFRRNTLESSESSASSSGYESSAAHRYSSATSEEEVEDMVEAVVNAAVDDTEEEVASGRSRSFRPLVRRMLSGNDLRGGAAARELPRSSVRNESVAKVNAESKWSTIKRRWTKRSLDSAAEQDGTAFLSHQSRSSTAKVRGGHGVSLKNVTAEWQHSETSSVTGQPPSSQAPLAGTDSDETQRGPCDAILPPSMALPLLCDPSDGSKVKKARRASFLPFGPQCEAPSGDGLAGGDVARDHIYAGQVRSLMSYLTDLSELNFDQQQYLDKLHTRLPKRSNARSDLYASHRGSVNSMMSFDDVELSYLITNGSQRDVFESSASGGSSLPPSVNGEESAASTYKDSAHRRAHIISEIISTEETYVSGLRELIDIYVRPSGERDATQQSVIESTERRQVFGNIESIFNFHKDAFLPALRAAAAPVLDCFALAIPTMDYPTTKTAHEVDEEDLHAVTARAAEQLARTFERHAAFFRMYSSYVNNVDAAQTRVAVWKAQCIPTQSTRGGTGMRRDSNAAMLERPSAAAAASSSLTSKERKRIRTFMQLARANPRHSQLSLEAYLHLPVQRIPRYRLLFEDLGRSCPPERLSDKHSVLSALASITSVANMMNESKRQSEMGRRLLQWQERIHGVFPSPLVQPHRKLIHDGALTLRRIVSREPSFCVTRAAILGDATMYDHNEEPALLLVADATRPTTPDHDAIAGDEDVLQVCYLKQQSVTQELQVILCNDIIVIVEGSRDGSVKLFAALRVAGPARIINDNTLRIVGPSHILYLTAPSTREAFAWRQALETAQASSTT